MADERNASVIGNNAYSTLTSPDLRVSLIPSTEPSQQSFGRVLVLNGFPGTGKFTILKHAKERLPADRVCLMDNHLLIDPVVAVIPGRNEEHHELRRKVRGPIFGELRKRALAGHTILMTACLVEDNERDNIFLQEHLDLVRNTEVPIFWVNAHCKQSVLEKRVKSRQRRRGGKTKLTDVGVLRNLVHTHRLMEPHPSNHGSMRLVVKTLDVSGRVEVSVDNLMSMIGLPQNQGGMGFANQNSLARSWKCLSSGFGHLDERIKTLLHKNIKP
ncbi:hypothetical protein GGR51DRAFT_506164 [Nemania sp. FL0031]|nr:hypothetical protein GGR51DRAFT_506164 [Nemania sp. FL0031]